MTHRVVIAAVALFVVAACASPGPSLESTSVPVLDGVTADDFGADWPFAVDGTLRCYEGTGGRLLVTLDTGDGIEYAVNGSARDGGFPDLDEEILPSWPDASMLGPVIDRGLELCE